MSETKNSEAYVATSTTNPLTSTVKSLVGQGQSKTLIRQTVTALIVASDRTEEEKEALYAAMEQSIKDLT